MSLAKAIGSAHGGNAPEGMNPAISADKPAVNRRGVHLMENVAAFLRQALA
jgi:hypothetical protein